MANTTVTDALFMANVAQVNAMENSKKIQAEGASFAQAMGDASTQNLKIDAASNATTVQPGARTTVENKRNPVDDKNGQISGNKSEDGSLSKSQKMDGAARRTSQEAEKIKDDIKETLDVSDEDIEEAMATLGMGVQDIFNQDSLKNLMMELSGCEDSLELLTNADLYNGMQNILDEVQDIANSIITEFGISVDEFSQMLENDDLFNQIIAEGGLSTGVETFGPIMENEVFQAEVPGNTSGDGKELKADSDDGDRKNIQVTVTKEDEDFNVSNQSKTETFRNISQTEKSQSNNEEGMANMTQTTTTVSVNELGEVVETVQRFSSAFSDANEIVSQVTETIKLSVSNDTTSMEMLLHPASLGTVNMQISSQNGVVTAHLLVQDEAVKAALESQLSLLKETFEEQGKTVEAVEVSVANYDLNRNAGQQMHDEQERENAFRMGKSARRRLRLDDISDEDIEDMEEDEQIAADMMRRAGNSLDYMA